MGFGTLLRYIIITIIVLYLINKVGKFLTNLFSGGNQSQSGRQGFNQQSQRRAGNVHVEPNPKQEKKFTAGEYVDYEEIE